MLRKRFPFTRFHFGMYLTLFWQLCHLTLVSSR